MQKRSDTTKVTYVFAIFITCSATYFLEVNARVSLKVATNGSFRVETIRIRNWHF